MVLVSECIAKAALAREESRGGHTRDDFPAMSAEWRQKNLICSLDGDDIALTEQHIPLIREDLLDLFDLDELKKYMTAEELPVPAEGGTA